MIFGELQIWAPVVAALGASALTGGATFGIAVWQVRRAQRNELMKGRRHAYSRLLAVTGMVIHSASILRLAQELRSGFGEGVEVALRIRKPLDLLELDDWMRKDVQPLYEAWSEVWTIGSAEAVTIGNRLVDLAADIVGQATSEGGARGPMMRRLLGEKWTDEQRQDWLARVHALGAARREFASLARVEIGVEVATSLTREEVPVRPVRGPTSTSEDDA